MKLLETQRNHHTVKTVFTKIGAQHKKKVVKQVSRVKYDGRKKNSSDMKPITLLKNPAIDGKEIGKSVVDILDAKSEQKKVRVSKFKEELSLSKTETKLRRSLDLSKWQKKRLHKLSAKKLKEKDLTRVPKWSHHWRQAWCHHHWRQAWHYGSWRRAVGISSV
jgi:hypothetical protein